MGDDKKSNFINAVDKDLHSSILRLEQKLRGLQAEIEAKFEALAYESDQTLASQSHAQLTALSAVVNKVLESIKAFINLGQGEDIPVGDFGLLNREELDEFHKTIKDDILMISLLKDKF